MIDARRSYTKRGREIMASFKIHIYICNVGLENKLIGSNITNE